jgi:formate hydrogenlyase transcriptional activator
MANTFERMKADEQNVTLLSFEKLLSEISTKLINLPISKIDKELRGSLQVVVEFLGVDRGSVFEFLPDMLHLKRVHSWTEEDVLPFPDSYEIEELPWSISKLKKKDLVFVEKVGDLPPEANIDQQALMKYGIRSALMIPMIAGGDVIGAIAMSTIQKEMVWPRQLLDRIKVIGNIFASALTRKRAEQALHKVLSEVSRLKEQLEAENIYLRKKINIEQHLDKIIGHSAGLKHVLFRASQVAQTDTTVLIYGETGTGKNLIAAAIHNLSLRKDRPLITVNCAALPANLIESELFGREKGAFTGADARQAGRFEIAHNSTICLDEIGDLPLELQAKLLRLIQDGEFERLGSPYTRKVDVRIIATTNRNLEEEVHKGKFRQDLYYRLNVFLITIPPLRDRKEDIPLLVEAFTDNYAKILGKKITSVSKNTMKSLQEYPWPGNIRELESVIERSVILCSGPVLRLADKLTIPSHKPINRRLSLQEMEREYVLNILAETRWRIEGENGAAVILGLHPSTLRSRIRKLGIK